ncbi:MAG: KH domain-containing protein [Candidatus Helarchaeota archaeon]
MERIAIVIGPNGETKKKIERATKTAIFVDSKDGTVSISSTPDMMDPLALWQARDIVRAISRGFNPSRAFRLLKEGQLLEIINLHDLVGKSKKRIQSIKGRLIGEEGKTRRIIEETTECYMSVYGHTVCLIGDYGFLRIARKAIQMIVEGLPHAVIYKFLQKKRREMKKKEMAIWKPFISEDSY